MSKKNANPKIIQSVQRALDILECFDELNVELSLGEISERLSLNKSTVHGIIKTLSINEYIDQNISNGKYLLSPKLLGKSQLVSDSIAIRLKEIGSFYIKKLSSTYQASSRLFSCKDHELIFLEMVKPTNSYYTISSVTGYPIPMHATASGKVVLAHMGKEKLEHFLTQETLVKFTDKTFVDKKDILSEIGKIYENGYGVENEEIEIGIFAIASPIYDNNSNLIGVLSITGSVGKLENQVQNMHEDMADYSKKITKELFGV